MTLPSTRSGNPRDARPDAYRATGPSPGRPTLHLLGVGHVGRALLALLEPTDALLVAASDTTGTVHDPGGLDAAALARWKAAGHPLAGHPLAIPAAATPEGLRRVGADVVVDATSTRFDRPRWAGVLDDLVVGRGGVVAFAAKDAPASRAHAWMTPGARRRVGVNATLGGAGAWLADDMVELREECVTVALAGNGSTTVILQAMEAGGSFEDGVAAAERLGLLETDPELDFRGADAAVKLAVVAQALWGLPVHPDDVPCEDIRAVDPALVRARARAGRSTRLVARGHRDGRLLVGYEELAPGSPLAVPPDRAVYAYELARGGTRLHVGAGMGPEETARAVLADVRILAGTRGGRPVRRSARIEAPGDGGVVHLPASFRLESGAALHPAHVAFDLQGPEDAPVLVVLRGGVEEGERPGRGPVHRRSTVGSGSPATSVGVGAPRVRRLEVDCLGAVGASTGPAASTHWIDGSGVSAGDQARAVLAVLDALRIARVRAVIDGPYGGGVALRIASDAPERIELVHLRGDRELFTR